MGVASCLLLLKYSTPSLQLNSSCMARYADRLRDVGSGTAQAEEKCGHASDRGGCVRDDASDMAGYKRMEARLCQIW